MSKTVLSKVAGKVPANPASALEAFNMLVKAHHDYKVTAETERTKRSAIEAWRQVQVGNLQMQKELLQSYLSQTFAERRHVIDEMFDRLDQGIESGNTDLMNMAMSSIVNIVQTSPLKDAQVIMQSIADPNVQRIEF